MKMLLASVLTFTTVACVDSGSESDWNGDTTPPPASEDSGSGAGSGSGSSEQPPPVVKATYEVAETAGGCETLPFDAAELEIQPYVRITDTVPLPFDVPFYEQTITEVVASDQGQLFLFEGSSHSINIVSPEPIPTAGSPTGFVAPLWTTHLMSYLRGKIYTAQIEDHFVIQWNDFFISLFAPDQASHVTMQVRLYPDGTIETAYCQLAPSASSSLVGEETGSKGTIGIEAPDGVRGVQFAYKTEGAIGTSMGLRFTRK